MTDEPTKHRFLTISQAVEELNVNQNQIRALIRTGSFAGSRSGVAVILPNFLFWAACGAGFLHVGLIPASCFVRFVRID